MPIIYKKGSNNLKEFLNLEQQASSSSFDSWQAFQSIFSGEHNKLGRHSISLEDEIQGIVITCITNKQTSKISTCQSLMENHSLCSWKIVLEVFPRRGKGHHQGLFDSVQTFEEVLWAASGDSLQILQYSFLWRFHMTWGVVRLGSEDEMSWNFVHRTQHISQYFWNTF